MAEEQPPGEQPHGGNAGLRVKMDIPAAVFFVLLALYIFIAAQRFPELGWKLGGSPAFYPRILALLLAVFSAAMVWKSRTAPTVAVLPVGRRLAYLAACAAGCLIMPLALIPLIGFRLSAVVFMFLVMLGGQRRKPGAKQLLWLSGASVLVSAIIYGAFTYLARVRLPVGSLTGW